VLDAPSCLVFYTELTRFWKGTTRDAAYVAAHGVPDSAAT